LKEFAGRLTRFNADCPSHKQRPGLKNIAGGASLRYTSVQSILSSTFRGREVYEIDEVDYIERRHKKGTATTFFSSSTGDSFPSHTYAKDLNMDHLYMSFPEYLWIIWQITIPLSCAILFGGRKSSGVWGILKMKIAEGLGYGTKNSPEIIERKLVDLILGTSLVTWITDVTSDTSGNLTGQLLLPQACHVFCDGTVTAGDLRILIDIRKRMIIESTFMNKKLEMGDALSLAFLNGAVYTHPVIHSYAN